MPTPTYNLIQQVTVSGVVTTSVSFTSIPSTFDDLIIVCKGDNALNEAVLMRFNSDSGANYERINSGAAAASSNSAVTTAETSTQLTSGDESNNYIVFTTIFGYTDSNWRKSLTGQSFTELGADNNTIRYFGGMWNDTSTITTITFSTSTGTNFVAGTVFQLYGIKGSN